MVINNKVAQKDITGVPLASPSLDLVDQCTNRNKQAYYSAHCRRVHGYLESDINSEPT